MHPLSSSAQVVCEGCDRLPQRLFELGSPSDPVDAESIFFRVAKDSRGRFVVGPLDNNRRIAVYDQSGRFLRELGRVGSGPGEFRALTHVRVGAGDSVYTYDMLQRRFTVFSPDYRPVRGFSVDRLDSFVVGPGSAFTGVGIVRTPQRIGYPIHQYALHDGSHLRSWGGDRRINGSSEGQRDVVQIAPTRSGEMWVLRKRPTRVELYTADGTLHRVLAYRPPWLPSADAKPKMLPAIPARGELGETPPRPAEPVAGISDLREGSGSSLLILGAVPAADWRGKANPWIGGGEHHSHEASEHSLADALDGWFDTIVERVDPLTNRLLGRVRIRAGVVQLVDESHLAVIRSAANGRLKTEIWKIEWAKQ